MRQVYQQDAEGRYYFLDDLGNRIYQPEGAPAPALGGGGVPRGTQVQPALPAPPPGFGGRSAGALFGDGGQQFAPTPAPTPNPAVTPTSQRRSQRFTALVEAGLIDPRNIVDPTTNRIRPDIWALIEGQVPGYRGVAPPGGEFGGEPGTEWRNPAEVREAQWEQTHQALENERLANRFGFSVNPATGQAQVTATYGGQLLDRFGTARVAEERYRQQVMQAQQAGGAGQASLDAALARQQAVAMQAIPGRANIGQEMQQAAAQRAVNEAQMAYNRARGVGRNIERPIGVAELGQGLTEEQFGAAGQAIRQGYTDEELEELRRNPNMRGARYRSGQDYLRAAAARGVAF